MEGNCYSVLRIEDEGGKALTLYRAIWSRSRGRNEVQGHGVMARALELWIRPRQAGLPSTAVCAPFCNGAVTQRTNCTVTGPGWGPCWAAWAKAEEGVGAATWVSFSLGKPVPKSAGRIGSEPGSPAEKPGTSNWSIRLGVHSPLQPPLQVGWRATELGSGQRWLQQPKKSDAVTRGSHRCDRKPPHHDLHPLSPPHRPCQRGPRPLHLLLVGGPPARKGNKPRPVQPGIPGCLLRQ